MQTSISLKWKPNPLHVHQEGFTCMYQILWKTKNIFYIKVGGVSIFEQSSENRTNLSIFFFFSIKNLTWFNMLIYLRTKVLYGPHLCRGLRKALQQINQFRFPLDSLIRPTEMRSIQPELFQSEAPTRAATSLQRIRDYFLVIHS